MKCGNRAPGRHAQYRPTSGRPARIKRCGFRPVAPNDERLVVRTGDFSSHERHQWRAEIWGNDPLGGPIFKAFEREVNSFLRREPMSSFVKILHLDEQDPDPFYYRWITHGVTVSAVFCSFPTIVYFYCETEKYLPAGRPVQTLATEAW
jgi:hypothetical protein